MIGCNYVPDFNSVHPQGVQWDSLESFKVVGGGEVVDTPALHAFLRAQRRQLYYMYCSMIIYIIYFILYNICVRCEGLVVQ